MPNETMINLKAWVATAERLMARGETEGATTALAYAKLAAEKLVGELNAPIPLPPVPTRALSV